MRVFICFFVFIYLSFSVKASEKNDILIFTVATNNTNGLERYQKSAQIHGIKPTILGFGEKWKGGDNLKTNPGGGWKINLLKKALQPFEGEKDKIILFTDAYDVIFLSDTQKIVEEFQKTGAKVLFGAESFCWPIASLENSYPEINDGKRFLNSGLYIGYISEIVNLLNRAKIEDVDDDQLYFTKAYLDQKFRKENGIKLDHKSEIFQNLNGASNDVEIIPIDSKESKESDISLQKYKLKNVVYQTEPLVIHGNGPSKISLNYIENYFVKYQKGENEINLDEKSENELPTILMALFIEAPTPFIMEQLIKLQALDYPRNKIHLFIHYATKYHTHHVNNFVTRFGDDYQSIKQIIPDDGTPEWTARDLSLDYCLIKQCDYYFAVDSIAHLDNSQVLRLLIEQNRTVVAPMLSRWGKAWSNFWGALTADGFYARSNDYMDIVHRESVGLWNVPFIANCYLIKADLLKTFNRKELTYSQENVDADMAFCKSLRDIDVFMYLTNKEDFGHLVNPDSFDISRTEPDMYQIFDNEKDWEDRYIHPEYFDSLNPDKKQLQPCPDVYWFPIVSETFCHSLINMMERFGKWSSGKNDDERLEGGYEAVPTRDIHMNQVGWEPHWLQFLQKYVRPLQEHVFTGYFHDPPKSLMNFVVRYRPDEQPSLRPHHDSSTYTINIALNRKGVDYQGGGCKFLRYNCSVTDTKQGWMLMHPGRLTHFHEGLLVTEGTRYIMISFVDP